MHRIILSLMLLAMCVSPALAQVQTLERLDYIVTNKAAFGDKEIQPLPTLTDVLRLIGAGDTSSGQAPMRPTVLDNDGDLLKILSTSVDTAGA